MLKIFKRSFLFYLKYLDMLLHWMEKYVIFRFILRFRFILVIAVYFGVLYGQRLLEFDSPFRKDFYFVGMALFQFLLVLSILYRSIRVTNIFSVVVLFSYSIYLFFEVYNEICCDGQSNFWSAIIIVDIAIALIRIIGFLVIQPKDI